MRGCLSCSGLLGFRCRAGIPREPEISGREKVEGRKLGFIFENPSPRVWGKLLYQFLRRARLGLIPACAGKTLIGLSWPCSWAAHPRVCGENERGQEPLVDWAGSSPRVRGKRDESGCSCCRRGLIPACAGKTTPLPAASSSWRAHPRVCGENVALRRVRTPVAGSSPRVRGKPEVEEALSDPAGLIPACAGKTLNKEMNR